MGKVYKFIVQVSDNCRDLLKYIDKNIDILNSIGIEVRIEKISKKDIDDEMLEYLRKKNITRLPTMITPNNDMISGLKKITDIFEKNIKYMNINNKFTPAGRELNAGDDVSSYLSNQIYSGVSMKDKKFSIEKEPNDEDDPSRDIQEKMNMYMKNRPKHHTGSESNIENNPRRRRVQSVTEDENEVQTNDNIQAPPPGPGADDSMDDMMINAWLQNNM